MVEWLKERKLYLIVGILLVLFFSYAYFSNFIPKEDDSYEENWLTEEENPSTSLAESASVEDPEKPSILMADIKGAVKIPGVYEVNDGERVIDLIEKAGGLLEDADSTSVNFAMKVSDEMVVYIPKIGEDNLGIEGGIVANGQQSITGADGGKVNLNTASTSELETLPGIGPAKSSAILEFRETNGGFKTIEDLKSISGIGEKTFEKLQDMITVK